MLLNRGNATLVLMSLLVFGQSGFTQSRNLKRNELPKGTKVSLNGYCPVTAKNQLELVKGSKRFQYFYPPDLYLFKDKQALDEFAKSKRQEKYIPGLGGICPVSAVFGSKPVFGDPKVSLQFDNQLFWFSTEEAREKFKLAPWRYLPAFRGYCNYCFFHSKVFRRGSYSYRCYLNGRMYLFPSLNEFQKFDRAGDKSKYLNFDLVDFDVVVKADRGETVTVENRDFASTKDGITYFFINDANRTRFEEDSDKYKLTVLQSVDSNGNVVKMKFEPPWK